MPSRYEDTEGIVLDGIEMCHDLGTDSGTEHRVIGQIWVWSKSETSEVKKALAHTFDDKVVDGGVSTFFFPSPMKSVFAVRVCSRFTSLMSAIASLRQSNYVCHAGCDHRAPWRDRS